MGQRRASFARNQIKHIARIVGSDQGNPDINAVNAVIALVDGIRPENELEAAVALQIGLTHQMAGKMLAMAAGSCHLEHRERYFNLATKLQRTMAAHIDALVKLRANGKASPVGQVTVNDGGQAIVGTVNIEGRPKETEG